MLDATNRARVGDTRRDEEYAALRELVGGERSWLDLPAAWGGFSPSSTYHLRYGAGHELDTIHAKHLAHMPGVQLALHRFSRHGLARRLRNTGTLDRLLDAILA